LEHADGLRGEFGFEPERPLLALRKGHRVDCAEKGSGAVPRSETLELLQLLDEQAHLRVKREARKCEAEVLAGGNTGGRDGLGVVAEQLKHACAQLRVGLMLLLAVLGRNEGWRRRRHQGARLRRLLHAEAKAEAGLQCVKEGAVGGAEARAASHAAQQHAAFYWSSQARARPSDCTFTASAIFYAEPKEADSLTS
jgi:hypothetical protein